jgi:energy-coupling factor transporter ATP-binding protein EcfA2
MESNLSDVNKEIIDWVNAQPYWVQLAVSKLYGQTEIKNELIDELLALLKTPEGQSKDTQVDLTPFFKSAFDDNGDIRIHSIGEIEGIDALAPRTPLPFSHNLSVIYGNNGSGKSGYARILKKLCGKPNAAELQPNVFKELPQNRQCKVEASINGDDKSFLWQANENPAQELTPVDVFDSQTGFFYIDKEQEINYVPNEVALFEQLVSIYQQLQQKLKEELGAIGSVLPAKPADYGDTKYIKGMFERLKHDTDINTVEEFYKFSVEDKAALVQLGERLSASPTDLAVKKQKRKTQLENILNNVMKAAKHVSNISVERIKELELDAKTKREIAQQGANAIVTETSFDGFGTEIWKAMWEAARNYSKRSAYPEAEYPYVEQGSKCVLCEQELDESARKRLEKFESYVAGELESSATLAETALKDVLDKLPTKPEEQTIVMALQAAQLDESEWLPIFKGVWGDIQDAVSNAKDKEREIHKFYDLAPDTFKPIQSIIESLDQEVEQHQKDAVEFDKNNLINHINELRSKEWASSYVDSVKDEISNLKEKQKISELLKSVNTAAISKEAGRVSEILVTEAFVDRFNNELILLGASKVTVELVKTRPKLGRVYHKVQLQGLNHQHSRSKAMSVLSEGEQRIVSLAAFLADVGSKPNSAPFIFDDPISSLDQTYEEHTAKRLVSLSENRQVIVFTHRLSLLGQLIDNGNAECRYIRREPWGCGEHGDVPLFGKKPVNAVKDLKNNRLSVARKMYDSHGFDNYYPLAKAICSDFRILLERIVETELLADVIKRHRRDIHTKNKINLLAKITKDDCELIEKLMSDFSCFEHSQSDESPVEIPEPDILESYLDSIIIWHEAFKTRVH